MPSAIGRGWVLSGIALCAVLAGPVAIAQASDNTMRATLNHYAPKIVKDENAVRTGLIGYPQGKVKPLVRALNHEVGDLRALKRKLAQEQASSARGTKAKRLIIKGLGLIANAYGALRRDIQAAHGGAVPRSKVAAAVRTDKKGRAKLLAGLKLLR
ncbi:MAG: hypothetical protein JO046_21135 [Solirubrobacterales bacterium]|nr:hypothetical protein [Solirubrobacterales bacterium]